ncbi:MAG: methyltransferase domain-containing protein [Verrucomicrobia bacterium]|nr:methyltransferase domain-containing protein [Verrucomicrobiota bacterium]
MMTLFELLRSLHAVEYRLAQPRKTCGVYRHDTSDLRLAEALRARIPANVLANYDALRDSTPQWMDHPELFPMAVLVRTYQPAVLAGRPTEVWQGASAVYTPPAKNGADASARPIETDAPSGRRHCAAEHLNNRSADSPVPCPAVLSENWLGPSTARSRTNDDFAALRPIAPVAAGGIIQRRVCPGCGGRNLAPLGRYATREAPLDVVVCEACGLAFTNPMLTDERKHELQPDVRRLHRSRSSELGDERALRRSRQRAARWEYLITSRLRPGSRVLELGAGDGALIELLLQHGHHPVALDPDESACDFLRQRFDIKTIPCRVEDADLNAWGDFDAVFLLNLIEHLEDPAAVLTKIGQHLRPGGLIAIETPNILRTKVGPRRMFSLPHNYYFSPNSLLRLVMACGYHPVHRRVFHRDMFHFTARWGGPPARGLPVADGPAEEVRRAIRQHAWAYYLGAQFLLRKLPGIRQWYLYGRYNDTHLEEAPLGASMHLPRWSAAVRCLLSFLATVPA